MQKFILVNALLFSMLISACHTRTIIKLKQMPMPVEPTFTQPQCIVGKVDSFVLNRLLIESDAALADWDDREVYLVDKKQFNEFYTELCGYLRELQGAPVWQR